VEALLIANLLKQPGSDSKKKLLFTTVSGAETFAKENNRFAWLTCA
jgi:hypothetical protein